MLQEDQQTLTHTLRTIILKSLTMSVLKCALNLKNRKSASKKKSGITYLSQSAKTDLKEEREALGKIEPALLDRVEVLEHKVPHLRLSVEEQKLEALPGYHRAPVLFVPRTKHETLSQSKKISPNRGRKAKGAQRRLPLHEPGMQQYPYSVRGYALLLLGPDHVVQDALPPFRRIGVEEGNVARLVVGIERRRHAPRLAPAKNRLQKAV